MQQKVVRGWALGIQPPRAAFREGKGSCLLISSALFRKLWRQTGRNSHGGNPSCSPQPPLSPLKSAHPREPSELSPHGCCVTQVFRSRPACSAALLVWLFCLIFSLIPWLSEIREGWFSGAFGCLLILDWLLLPFGCSRKGTVSTYVSPSCPGFPKV